MKALDYARSFWRRPFDYAQGSGKPSGLYQILRGLEPVLSVVEGLPRGIERSRDALLAKFSIFAIQTMQPDYPHKIFNDKRMGYCLLMEALAMDSRW